MERRAVSDPDLSIPVFFAGKTVLLTGATGFLAKAVLEKILRDLPEIGKVILLIRGKGGSKSSGDDAWKRADSEIFGSVLFGRLREERGGDFDRFVREKIECSPGDVRLPDLGLGEEGFAKFGQEVDLVINCAASVNFDERLDTALETNVFGVANLLEFARTAGAVLVQVSTAYVCGSRNGEIEEAVVPLSFDLEVEIARLRGIVEGLKSAHPGPEIPQRDLVRCGMEQANARGWIDTYTYTKSLGEHWLALHCGEVAAVIVRPSIIESTLREPEPGWIEGLRMADPLLVAAWQGLTRIPMDLDAVLDLIPLDFVVNAILVASSRVPALTGRCRVVAVATGSENPLVKRELVRHIRDFYERHPYEPGRALRPWRYPSLEGVLRFQAWRLRLLRIGHGLLEQARLAALARRVRRRVFHESRTLLVVRNYGPYLKLKCRFQTRFSRELNDSLSTEDSERFGFDVRGIDWGSYLKEVHLPGLFRQVLRRPIAEVSTEPTAQGVITSPQDQRAR